MIEMAVLGQIGGSRTRKLFALFVCMLMVVAAVSSPSLTAEIAAASENENAEKETVPESLAEVETLAEPASENENAEKETVTESLAEVETLAEPTQYNTFLVSHDDGTVQAWGKSDVALWSFSSGPPLTSFRWLAKTFDEEGEHEEEKWNVNELRLKIGRSLSVYNPLNGTLKSLKITFEDLRHGSQSAYMRDGEIIQVDRLTILFLVDIDSGAIIQELRNGNTEDLKLDEERKSCLFLRTDYIAKASKLSGSSLWSLSYGEIETLVTGLESPIKGGASLSLLPKMTISSPGVPTNFKSRKFALRPR